MGPVLSHISGYMLLYAITTNFSPLNYAYDLDAIKPSASGKEEGNQK